MTYKVFSFSWIYSLICFIFLISFQLLYNYQIAWKNYMKIYYVLRIGLLFLGIYIGDLYLQELIEGFENIDDLYFSIFREKKIVYKWYHRGYFWIWIVVLVFGVEFCAKISTVIENVSVMTCLMKAIIKITHGSIVILYYFFCCHIHLHFQLIRLELKEELLFPRGYYLEKVRLFHLEMCEQINRMNRCCRFRIFVYLTQFVFSLCLLICFNIFIYPIGRLMDTYFLI